MTWFCPQCAQVLCSTRLRTQNRFTLLLELLSGQRTLRRGNAARLAGIDLGRGAQHTRDGLEARLRDMMVVGAVDVLDMQRDAGVLGERVEEFTHQFGIERADLRGRERDVPDEEGTAGDIDGGAGEPTVSGEKSNDPNAKKAQW